MNVGHHLGKRLRAGGALAIAVTLASAGVAVASNAVKGASYSGRYKGESGERISFKVSASGKRVIDLSVATPYTCSSHSGCGGVPSATAGSASISSKGTFKVTLKLFGPGTHKVEVTDTVTGTFLKHGNAKGTVKSHFISGSPGKTVSWTATS